MIETGVICTHKSDKAHKRADRQQHRCHVYHIKISKIIEQRERERHGIVGGTPLGIEVPCFVHLTLEGSLQQVGLGCHVVNDVGDEVGVVGALGVE